LGSIRKSWFCEAFRDGLRPEAGHMARPGALHASVA
jgi:hypothetical protein